MLGRQDGESLTLMFSDRLDVWDHSEPLASPQSAWDLVQLGNCGSPIETPAGWLVLTHGVGPLRRYCMGACLLDLEDPRRVSRQLRNPLLEPDPSERSGYVPNVVYTCGAMLYGEHLVLPYAMSDTASKLAVIKLADLLTAMN